MTFVTSSSTGKSAMTETGTTDVESRAIDSDPVAEARRLLAVFNEVGLLVRVLGGVAVKLAVGDRLPAELNREVGDLDLICAKEHGSQVEKQLAELGWDPAREFNAINGARRMLFHDPNRDEKLDVFVGVFEMAHRLPLSDRLAIRDDTLAPSDLLLTKLQVVELNAKDRGDAYALLGAIPINEQDGPSQIGLDRLTSITTSDWGWHRTCELNLERLRQGLGEVALPDKTALRIREAIDRIEDAMEGAPKSRSWRLRARIGERKRWYEEPSEVDA